MFPKFNRLFLFSAFAALLATGFSSCHKNYCLATIPGSSTTGNTGSSNNNQWRSVGSDHNVYRRNYYSSGEELQSGIQLRGPGNEEIVMRRAYPEGGVLDGIYIQEHTRYYKDPYASYEWSEDLPGVGDAYERYNPFNENDWVLAGKENKSTFSIDVDNAAYTNFRRYINSNHLPPKDAIRLEEWLNFFNYDLEAPAGNDEHPLKITTEIGECPWNKADDLVMIKLQGKRPVENELPPCNLVFLVDVSASMNQPNKLPLVQESMLKLSDKLRAQDKLSIVTYAGASYTALLPTAGDQKDSMRNAINRLSAGGGTNGSGGILTAYELAEKNYDPAANNRVIIATDGDWNMGITDDAGIKKLVEEKRTSGIFLSVLGFGMRNLNDQMMEMLADNGNGNYVYIDSEKEAERVFNTEFAGAMYVIAKDVKLQVEFDSLVVDQYRLIGYENRVLENWQFEADSIDGGDLGMGQNVIAFYQVKRKEGQDGPLGKIDFRYKPLNSDASLLLSHNMADRVSMPGTDFNFASCVAEFALCLRESEFRSGATMSAAIWRGKMNLGDETKKLSYEKRVEFVGLMEAVAAMYTGYVAEEATEMEADTIPPLKLYPNPASEYTIIEVPQECSKWWSIQVFSVAGVLMSIQHFQESTTGRVELNGLPAGTYLVKVYSGGNSFGYLRLVVQ